MKNFDFAGLAADADVERASLEVGAVGAGSEFAIFFVNWRPVFDVVFFGGGRTQIAGSDVDNMVWNAKGLPDVFFDGEDFFVHFFGFFGKAENVHFEFVELVDAEETTSVFAVGASFFAETGGKAGIAEREFVFVDDFVHMITSEWHFGRSDQCEIFAFDIVFVGLFGGTRIKAAALEDF